MYFIREIAYWLKPEYRHDELVNTSRYEAINSLYENLLENIKTNKINMYSNEYYNRYNMILLFDDEKYMSFIKKKINKDNLMLFILDCISVSTGSYGIGYNFNTQNLDKFYGWEKAKKDIKQCPESDLKDFLVKAIETPNPYNSIDEKIVIMKFKFTIFFTSSLFVDSNNKYNAVNIVIYVTELALTFIVDNIIYLKVKIKDIKFAIIPTPGN